jgi:hypothetical protein
MNPNSSQTRNLQQRSRALEQKKKSIGTEKKRISFATDLLMKMGAVLFDILGLLCNLIPFVGGFIASLVSVVGNLLLFLAYFLKGVKPIIGGKGNKTIMVRIIVFFFELVPYVNILPGFSIAVWYTNRVVRKEDKEYNKSIRETLTQIQNEERQLMQEYATSQYNEQIYENEQEDNISA